jgi:hypothetical protein
MARFLSKQSRALLILSSSRVDRGREGCGEVAMNSNWRCQILFRGQSTSESTLIISAVHAFVRSKSLYFFENLDTKRGDLMHLFRKQSDT